MDKEKIGNLALRGVSCVLTVDPRSLELINLYTTDEDVWRYLLHRCGRNKMTVTIRGPHDYTRYLRMPPSMVIDRLKKWRDENGELRDIQRIVEEILEDE